MVPRSLARQHQDASPRTLLLEQPHHLIGAVTGCDAGRLIVVVVNSNDIRGDTFPTVIAHDGTGWIECLGQMIEGLDIVSLRGAIGKIGHTPRFIDRYPSDN